VGEDKRRAVDRGWGHGDGGPAAGGGDRTRDLERDTGGG